MSELTEYVDGLPYVSGAEEQVRRTIADASTRDIFRPESKVDFGRIKSAFAIALHMHQPLIPAGGADLRTAAVISNLKHMMDNPHVGDNHNAPVFHWCYKRMGDLIPRLCHEGKEPRVMLEYSGTLLHGLRDMGLHDVFDALRKITLDHRYRRCVEWLGMPWGHAVAPSTPIQDYRLHVLAFQQHFAAIFGMEALSRIRGFSPSEMALPNHPDSAYAFVKTLVECGYQWVLVQEHTVEQPESGNGPSRRYLPNRLVCRSSDGETAEIIAIVKTQGSDTKLVGQMQPLYEARSMGRVPLAGTSVAPLVTQIADGENGGVMMNEFPPKFLESTRSATGSETPAMNVSEYLEHLFASGVTVEDLPVIQPILQKRIWDTVSPGAGPDKVNRAIEELKRSDPSFHMGGGSWTNNISWVRGYENVLGPMEKASSLFNQKLLQANVPTSDRRFRNALFHLMATQTSCYRYWGQGTWTDYGVEICRRVREILEADFT